MKLKFELFESRPWILLTEYWNFYMKDCRFFLECSSMHRFKRCRCFFIIFRLAVNYSSAM